MSRILIVTLLFTTVVLAACGASSAATEPPATAALQTTATAIPTNSPVPPAATSTPTNTPPPEPTNTPANTATPTPTPVSVATPALRQLTNGGCCVQPSFSPDGRQILFIDKPGENALVGIYGVDFVDPQPTPELVSQLIGFRNPDHTIVAIPEGNLVRFINEVSGESWTVDTDGNWPYFSPNSGQIIWTASDQEGPYDRRRTDIWLANLNGSEAELLLSLYGGGLAGWFPEGERVLLSGRDDPALEDVTLFVYDLASGRRTDLYTEERLRGVEISPGGSWIIFYITFADEPANNGFWIATPAGSDLRKLDLPGFGAYQWRNDNTLLYIPMRASADESMQLWAVNAATGETTPLTDPASLSFSIANGDWAVSPDGRHVIFVNSQDQNIWAISLP